MSDMAINPTGATDANTALGNAVQQAAGGQLGEQAFLKLLVTQLTNQDPLSPQDNSQFLAQLAQFSTVEGVNNVASSQQQVQATALLGKTVSAVVVKDNVQTPVVGKVTGVKFDSNGVSVSVDDSSTGSSTDLTLDQIQQVTN